MRHEKDELESVKRDSRMERNPLILLDYNEHLRTGQFSGYIRKWL